MRYERKYFLDINLFSTASSLNIYIYTLALFNTRVIGIWCTLMLKDQLVTKAKNKLKKEHSS